MVDKTDSSDEEEPYVPGSPLSIQSQPYVPRSPELGTLVPINLSCLDVASTAATTLEPLREIALPLVRAISGEGTLSYFLFNLIRSYLPWSPAKQTHKII